MTQLKDKVVWITGASSGIGEALVYETIKKGAKLIISARREQELLPVQNNCQEFNLDHIKIILTFDF
ncbi:SDR family NAD(P)-dependent oxidoreductase [Xenococcus sp. PCC 7305]|uniref:SDR family NAD(P)-dependent oxidoreductase n=1 Tax=Xenococcus sp. PCC 7305 TaxID=102125 RepID=UPI0002DFB36B|nr:SDR family NAD(P)-dependent oxidoreductase [Xenococcus sp. PCC 7305]